MYSNNMYKWTLNQQYFVDDDDILYRTQQNSFL